MVRLVLHKGLLAFVSIQIDRSLSSVPLFASLPFRLPLRPECSPVPLLHSGGMSFDSRAPRYAEAKAKVVFVGQIKCLCSLVVDNQCSWLRERFSRDIVVRLTDLKSEAEGYSA